jgi:hypothetical protein
VRSILSVFGIYVLVLLLAGTFPVGAGDALHGGALLHPAIPHVHTGSAGSSVQNQIQMPNVQFKVSLTPAIETTAGGATEVPTTAITPPLPRVATVPLLGQEERLVGLELPRPQARFEPPPDPPPTPFAFA